MRMFHEPTPEHLTKLAGPFWCAYSGGKDSSSLVVWIEWLRRSGWIDVAKPQLVQSDTQVEDDHLEAISTEMRKVLTASGWECAVVEPLIHEKLYNRILGIGNTPIYPGVKNMRWCTRSTKIDPMNRWRNEFSSGVTLTGLRLGESVMRDGKLKKKGCAAGGECGLPDPDARTYSPLLNWTTCNVIDWLNGLVDPAINAIMGDLFAVTKKLVEVYGVRIGQPTFEWGEPEITAARYGCIGCPAIGAEAEPPKSVVTRNGNGSPLNEIYAVWHEAREFKNRCWKSAEAMITRSKKVKKYPGPIRMAVRKQLFARIMDIQHRAGVVLIMPSDEKFIRECWEKKVYPRGWSWEDEATPAPEDAPLFV